MLLLLLLFESVDIFLYARMNIYIFFLIRFVVDFVWLYFLRLFDWCRCWCCRYWYCALKFTCIENHSRYIKKKQHTSQSKNFNFAHRLNTYNFFFVIFYFIYTNCYVLCKKYIENTQLVKCMTVYVHGNVSCVNWELSLFMYIIPFLFMTRVAAAVKIKKNTPT